jgi:hypothetical protein
VNRQGQEERPRLLHVVTPSADAPYSVLAVGTPVYVRNRFIGHWSVGFEVVEVVEDGYRLRRQSDGQLFPDVFQFRDVLEERRRSPQRGVDESYLDRRPRSG